MARVLIGWELGAYGGHLARIKRVGAELAAAGHRVTLALQRVDAPGLRDEPWIAGIWQAPLWPSLLHSVGRAVAAPPATLGDILATMGLARPGTFARLVAAWEPILAAERPDVVVGDYAPALLAAARGRCPLIVVSDAFDLPPTHLRRLPSLTGKPPQMDEGALLGEVNAGLAANGRAPLATLAELFLADLPLPCSFPMLDAYGAWRTGPTYRPFIDPQLVTRRSDARLGDEVFVYWPGTGEGTLALWQALSGLDRTVRVHAPQLTAGDHRWLAKQGLAIESAPVPYPLIAERSRLLVSHGGAGFASSGAIAGIPQLVIPLDLQKQLVGEGIGRVGAGAVVPAEAPAEAIRGAISALAEDGAMAARVRDLAEGLRASPGAEPEPAAAAAVAEWTGQGG